MASLDKTEELYSIMSKACFGGAQILGGRLSDGGISRGLQEELMKMTGVVCGKIRTSRLDSLERSDYLAHCKTAVAVGFLSKDEYKKIKSIVEGA